MQGKERGSDVQKSRCRRLAHCTTEGQIWSVACACSCPSNESQVPHEPRRRSSCRWRGWVSSNCNSSVCSAPQSILLFLAQAAWRKEEGRGSCLSFVTKYHSRRGSIKWAGFQSQLRGSAWSQPLSIGNILTHRAVTTTTAAGNGPARSWGALTL